MSFKIINFNPVRDNEKELLRQVEEKSSIIKIERALKYFAYRDILKISKEDNVLASFILCSCFIEQMATFRYGVDVGNKQFIDFVTEYLKDYDPVKLRMDLRNRLVHNYSLGETYALVMGHPQEHLQKHNNGIILNLENFVSDLGNALDKFIYQMNNDPVVSKIALQMLKKINIVSHGVIEKPTE